MAERRVSVRLAAVGGDRLKADLVAIGREGKAALAAIAGGSAPGVARPRRDRRGRPHAGHPARGGLGPGRRRRRHHARARGRRWRRRAHRPHHRRHRRPAPRRRRHRGLRPGARRHPGEVQSDVRGGEQLSRRARGDPGGASHRRDLGRRDERGDRPDEDRFARLYRGDQGPHDGDRADGLGLAAARRCRAGCCSTSSTTSACRSPAA